MRKNSIKVTEERTRQVNELAKYFVDNQSTIRETADAFKMSRSHVHYEFRMYLPVVIATLYHEVDDLLAFNRMEAHLRGGQAVRERALKKRF